MICKDCIHEELCVYEDEATSECSDFKDKTQVVEVVRCKDCIYYKLNRWSTEDKFFCQRWLHWIPTAKNDFCNYGKKVE